MEKIFSKYKRFILATAKEFQKNKNHRPRKRDYCTEVVKLVNNTPGYEKTTEEKARPQISKTIDKMSQGTSNDLLCLQGKYYVINNDTYFDEKLTEECYLTLRGRISVTRKDILKISYNMCGVKIKAKDNDEDIKKIVSDCLGENCFSVLKSKNLVLIMIKCNADDNSVPTENSREYTIMKAIEGAISRIYEDQKKEGLMPLKRKRKRKNNQEKIDVSENATEGS